MTENTEAKLHFLDYWKVIRQRAGLIALVFLLILGAAGGTAHLLPCKYLARVTMEVTPDQTKSSVASPQR